MNFVKWFRSEPHRDKYESDHPAFLAAREAWDASRKEALAQPEQEPVAWKDEQGNVRMTLDAGEIQSSVGYVYSVRGERIKNACIRSDIPNGTPLYTSPQAQRKPLSDEQWQVIADTLDCLITRKQKDAIEAVIGIKE